MERRPVGRSGLKVSALALGTMSFGSEWCGRRFVDEKTASSLLDLAIDAGVNLLDTADVYGLGASESMLGRLLGGRREKLLLATKVCGEMRPGDPSSGGLSARHIASALDASLKRLGTDRVDLYMAHAPDPRTPIAETLEAFGRAVNAGKARVVGCSNFSAEQLSEALKSASGSCPRLQFNQVEYNLACRSVEDDLAGLCVREKVSLLAWSPLGGGYLTGKYPNDRKRREVFGVDPSRLEGLMKVLGKAASSAGSTPGQAALGWVLAKPAVASAVVGASAAEQLRESLAARPLDAALASILDRASALCLGIGNL